jgi:asparagine synthase (glutamine-hydrolysing)
LLEVAAASRESRYARLMEVFPLELRAELWEPDFVRPAELRLQPGRPGIAGLQELDIETYLPDDLLLKSDIASMAHSLELRSPLLDHEVLEVGVSLDEPVRLRGKRALRAAFEAQLPPEVLERKKTGFGVPLSAWFRRELRDLTGDLLLDDRARARGQLRPAVVERLLADHASGRVDHGHRLWCLLMLELWQRAHVEAEQPAGEPLAAR